MGFVIRGEFQDAIRSLNLVICHSLTAMPVVKNDWWLRWDQREWGRRWP